MWPAPRPAEEVDEDKKNSASYPTGQTGKGAKDEGYI